jgi:ribosomal 50S subunit-recycling heat shock protein
MNRIKPNSKVKTHKRIIVEMNRKQPGSIVTNMEVRVEESTRQQKQQQTQKQQQKPSNLSVHGLGRRDWQGA